MIEKSTSESVEAKSVVDSSGKPRPMTLQDIQDFINLARFNQWPYSAAPKIVTDDSGTHLTFMQLKRKKAL